jgi:hypothetical protein
MIDKNLLLTHCTNLVLAKADELKMAIKSTREASNNDTKSSMGDKYETSREMLQQDINRLEQQLADTNLQLFNLRSLKFKNTPTVEVGSLVNTTLGLFFIAVSLGELMFGAQRLVLISLASPLGKQLNGKKEGDFFSLNGKAEQVLNIN